MDSLKGKRILIFQQRGWAWTIGHFLATRLHEKGCILAAVTLKRTTHKFITEQKDVPYELIISNDEIMSEPEKFLGSNPPSLEQICLNLGIDSIWPIVASLRNHVRSYKDKFYYSFKQNVPDDQIENYVKASYLYIERIFNEFKPDLILSPNIIALPHIMLCMYARNRGIKMVAVTDTKIKDWFMFSYSQLDDQGPVFDRLKEIDQGAESENRENAKRYIAEFRERFKTPSYMKGKGSVSLYKRLRHELSPFKSIWRWYTRPHINFLKSTGITLDNRPPRYILRDFYAEKKYKKFAEKFPYYPLEKISKCAYFPLQFQPEATIDVMAPYFNNQIETARLIAMSLPGDYTLVVKEHPEMVGLRSPSYLEKISRTPNVKLVDYRIPGSEVMKKADIIISPSGTTLAEAAFYNKPAIQLGALGTTLCFPNVFRHETMTTLPACIKQALSTNLRTPEYEKRLENYVAAVFDAGFKYDYVKTWEQGGNNREELWKIFEKEICKHL